MSPRIALLRGVNVGASTRVAMPALREMALDLGLADARTLLNSGNLVFRSTSPAGELETLLERETAARLGFQTSVFVRTAREWTTLVAANPFPDVAREDPGHLLVLFLKAAPTAAAVEALRAAVKGHEEIRAHGPQAFITFPDGIGRSRLTPAVLEARLGGPATGRNWNTVLKLADLAGA